VCPLVAHSIALWGVTDPRAATYKFHPLHVAETASS